MAVADLAIARAGAITLAELCAWGVPSILVPLPTAAADHQTHNARALAGAGAAIHLPQAELTGASLAQLISQVAGDASRRTRMSQAAKLRGKPNAAAEIVSHLTSLI